MQKNGLTTQEATQLYNQYGANLLPSKQGYSAINLFVAQFKNLLTLVLVIASILSFAVGDLVDGVLILVILFLNVLLGFWQEYKASKELEALKKLEVGETRVIRDGKEVKIATSGLVPGDLVVLESGDKVPADLKVLECSYLTVDEASLTGESVPTIKDTKENNALYFGTSIVEGRCFATVTQTGTNTRFGKIALTLSSVTEEETPLEVSLSKLAKKVGLIAILISAAVFGLRIFQGHQLLEVFFTSIALMVAAVPEGLPTVITILLALGVRRMYKFKTLVRRMDSVESLGATSVICTDKTGTLTENKMTVKQIVAEDSEEKLMKAAIYCSSASLVMKEQSSSFDVLGDTTEGALLIWGKENNLDYEKLRIEAKLIEEIPFNLKNRMMTTLWEEDGKKNAYIKGAPESVLALCQISKNKSASLEKEYQKLAGKGLRVLAVAQKNNLKNEDLAKLNELEFLGLVGIADTARVEVKDALLKAKKAGIKVVMITGDNELTAKSIAEEIGLLEEGDEIITGTQLESLSDEELLAKLDKIRIFARTVPEQKLRIVKAFQQKGEVVAVTGDGVNDSLALKQAHVGVAMGITGTDVAKEAADIVILDDNFATIITAIEQGRLIYSNIVKVVKFLFAGNLSELLLIVGAVLLNLPTPLLAVQILWINFVTDGLPALSLAGDGASSNLMNVPPRDKNSFLIGAANLKFIIISGVSISLISLLGFIYFMNLYTVEFARSFAFSSIVVLQMVMVFILRRHHSLTSNKFLLASVGLVLLMQLLIMTVPALQSLFKI